MEILYTTHDSLLYAHALSPALSWALVIGAAYGFVRLLADCVRQFRKQDRLPVVTKQGPGGSDVE